MAAALRRLGDRIADDFLAWALQGDSGEERLGVLLDHLWAVHRGPLFQAGVELWVAARTDPELRAAMGEVTEAFATRITEGIVTLFSDVAATPGFAERVMAGLATMRGLAMPGFVESTDPDILWSIARPQLLQAFATVPPSTSEPGA